MSACLWILVSLCEAEVYYEDDVLVLSCTNQEVVRLQIPMKEPILMYKLYSLQLHHPNSSRDFLTIWIASIRTVLREN